MFKKSVLAITFLTAAITTPAFAGPGPGNALNKLDYRLDQLERRGVIEQGTKADRVEDRLDRLEDRIDLREDRRDRAVDNGPLDRLEDRIDARENQFDRRENRRDRRR